MKIERTKLPGVLLITPDAYYDERGFFQELSNRHYDFHPAQANYSLSKKGVIRGLHYQTDGIAKLVSVLKGKIYDVAFNLSTGDWQGFELSSENRQQLLVPHGYAHGFQSLEDDTMVVYLMDNYFNPQTDAGINPNKVSWPLKKQIVSEKDKNAPEFPSK
jgi:dTDP-4-dehydrorhamnose 3,5-epimerase